MRPTFLASASFLPLVLGCTTPALGGSVETSATLSGLVEGSSFVVERSETVFVAPGTRIAMSDEVVIHGTLEVLPSDGAALEGDPPSLRIDCAGLVFVDGEIRGGTGSNGREHGGAGGQGTSIEINAPLLWVNGAIRAGDGGPGYPGGAGGDVDVYGWYLTGDPENHVGIVGGAGGRGVEGRVCGLDSCGPEHDCGAGSSGGDGGSAIAHDSEDDQADPRLIARAESLE